VDSPPHSGQLRAAPTLVLKRRAYVSPFTPPVFDIPLAAGTAASGAAGGALSAPPSPSSSSGGAGGGASSHSHGLLRSSLAFVGSGALLDQPVDVTRLPPLLVPAPAVGSGGGGSQQQHAESPYQDRLVHAPGAALRVGSLRERSLLFAQACTDWLNGIPVVQTAGSASGAPFRDATAAADRHDPLRRWAAGIFGGGVGAAAPPAPAPALRDVIAAIAALVAGGSESELDAIISGGSDLLEALAAPFIDAAPVAAAGAASAGGATTVGSVSSSLSAQVQQK
jgi:hypothetical protein